MKTVSKFLLAAFAVGVMGFNLMGSSNSNNSSSRLSLTNIKALQASAGESGCDGSNSDDCTIDLGNGKYIYGHGNAYYND